QDALRNLSALLDHVLTLARLDARVEVARIARVEVAAVLASAVAIVQPSARTRDVTIEVIGDTGAVIATDEQKLTTILINLLANAVEYGPKGGRVSVSVIRADGRLAIHVRDQGPGVPVEQRERIFDRFVRGDAPRAGGGGHHGLGLPIARGFAQVLDGELLLADSDGWGSDLVLELPLPPA